LHDPNFITEDEADIIMSDRSVNEPGRSISLDELLEENGQIRRKRRVTRIKPRSSAYEGMKR
jgi:hypothetical protein